MLNYNIPFSCKPTKRSGKKSKGGSKTEAAIGPVKYRYCHVRLSVGPFFNTYISETIRARDTKLGM